MKDARNIPAIRFKEFSEAWEQRRLGEIGRTYTGLSGKTKEDFGHGDACFVTYLNIFSNPIADIDAVEHVEIDSKQNEVQYGDVFFTTSSETPDEVGMSSVWLGKNCNTYLNSFCFGYRPDIEVDRFYLAYALRAPAMRRKIVLLAQGISRYNLSKNKMMEITLMLPSLNEQKVIGSILYELDTLITLHQRKIDALKTLKKALLAEMFPDNGSDKPLLRFKGFNDAWEQRRLGEIGRTYTGLSGKTKEDFGHGDACFVTYLNIFSNPIADIDAVEHVEIDSKQSEVQYGDVFFTTSSETPDEVGMSSVWLGKNCNTYLNSFCFGYRPDIEIDRFYLAYVLRAPAMRRRIVLLAQGISRYNISKNKMMEITLMLPSLNEQKVIGRTLYKLDTLITLHQRKLEGLKTMKTFLLQNMFI